ncbi:hypothetical protein [Hansschlegelia plantiphila]|uniref:Uncharacterized protein n=1 Tax=Hansschlegelia plantiphila TaxID=374655 RepID=A0A9W6MW84_9HYPH|nr:hypothetical protein [Hansschlegelia plantiphila]GLK69219.1 hypothetical protein GCM10008179_28570 [Hansschlegelia plantiphila]
MQQSWDWWRAALAGNFGPISDGVPHAGFYRTRRKGQPWEPVAIWADDASPDGWIALKGATRVSAIDLWTWCCRNPVSEEAYRRAAAGDGWADEPPAAPEPGIGHNSGSGDPVDAIRAELAGEEEMAAELLAKPIEDQAGVDKTAIWAKRIGDLAAKAEKSRVAEKEPHLEAGRAVDAKWKPVVEDAKALAAKLKGHATPFLIAQKRAEEERASAAAAEARRIREEADAAARAARADDEAEQARIAEMERQAAAADQAAVAKNATAGRTGARIALRTETKVIVTDFAAAAGHYVAARHADLVELIGRLASRDVKAGAEIPGTGRKTEERAA